MCSSDLLNLDSAPPEVAIQAVREHPAVSWVQVVKLPPVAQMPVWLG